MKSLRNSPMQTRRDAWVEVNLGAIETNTRAIRAHVPAKIALMAIVKADAYGHGAAMILPTLEASGVAMAGVASIDEAIHLRDTGIKMPILVIGTIPDWAVKVAADYDIALTIFDAHHLNSLKRAHTGKPVKVHIKVDTGMHRIGISTDAAVEFIRHCQAQDFIQVEGIFSHLADSHDALLTTMQEVRWQEVCAQIDPLPRWVHLGNTAHALGSLHSHAPNNLLRLGYGFYGYEPIYATPLKPTMSVRARIMHIQDVPADTGISYGHTYRTPKDGGTRRIATLPLGYADGIPRVLSNKIEALVGWRRVPQVGTITMDQLMIDVTTVPGAAIGETVTLIGEQDEDAIWLDDWAAKAGTIPYELMCGLRIRLPKTYTR